jgi:hypothetical protein
VWFVLKSRILAAKAKIVTLAFGRWVSEAGFGESMNRLDFRFGRGSCLEVFSWSRSRVASLFHRRAFFLALAFWGYLFFHQRFFLSPLHFGIASFFIGGLSFLAPCILGLPFFIGCLSFSAL